MARAQGSQRSLVGQCPSLLPRTMRRFKAELWAWSSGYEASPAVMEGQAGRRPYDAWTLLYTRTIRRSVDSRFATGRHPRTASGGGIREVLRWSCCALLRGRPSKSLVSSRIALPSFYTGWAMHILHAIRDGIRCTFVLLRARGREPTNQTVRWIWAMAVFGILGVMPNTGRAATYGKTFYDLADIHFSESPVMTRLLLYFPGYCTKTFALALGGKIPQPVN